MSRLKPLRELITFMGGGTPSKQVAEYWGGDIPWASVKDFTSTSLSETQDFITQEGLRNSSANLIPKGHVIIPTRMALGKAAINTVDLAINQDLRALVPKVPLDAKFLLHAVLSLKDEIVRKGFGATVKGITQEELYKLEIAFPPLDDQIRIAHLLSKVEGLIVRRKQHLQQLDDLLKSVFLEMFGDPVRNEKGWDVLPFHKVGQFISGGTPSKSRDDYWRGVFPWVSPKDMKVSKIVDAEDHISDLVFEETSLKRIPPGHLLIVVRGMILVHSFPVAINTVEIAINQDMKAIKPLNEINVIYLQSCLIALKRQIMKLISTAGHGTRKFDSIAMEKLYIPKPPKLLQIQFAAIVEKTEALKSRYQHSLGDLEALYGTLSQRAFKGELDLSRVPLPAAPIEEVKAAIAPLPTQATLTSINLPDSNLLLAALENREHLKPLLRQWLSAYRVQSGGNTLSVEHFMTVAQTRLAELHPDNDFELGADAYEHIKGWVFESLKTGTLAQRFDNEHNRVSLESRPADWGSWEKR